uniref:Uncharacterized protein n=1 Tax=Ciona intestinalis TaxID=7719 RepID=H2XRJ1_CIOIN
MPSATGTSKFVLLFTEWFDVMNCCAKFYIRTMNDSRIKFLQSFFNQLLMWKNDVHQNHVGEDKRLLATPTLIGLIFTTTNYIELCRQLLLREDIQYVCLKTFTQDNLDAFFGNPRQLGRRSQNPDIFQASFGIQHITQIIKHIKGGNTTFGNKNAWTSVSDEPLPKKTRKSD